MTGRDRVLVTGAGGHLGGHAARLLAESGHDVYGTSRGEVNNSHEVHWLSCDLSKLNEVHDAVKESKPSLVLHTVGLAGENDPLALLEANVVSLANLVMALKGVPVDRLLVVGSAAEYAASDQREPIREDHLLAPNSRYGLTKLFQFELSQMALRTGMPVVYARPFNLVGPGVSSSTAVGDISKRLADLMHGQGSGFLDVGDLDRWRDYVDVRDVAAAFRILLENAPPGGVYNVCSGKPVLLADVVDKLLSLAGKEVKLRQVEGSPSVTFQVGDSSRLRTLGWSPAYDLDDSLRDGLQAHFKSGPGN